MHDETTPTPPLCLRPLVFTSRRERWLRLLDLLGAHLLEQDEVWTVAALPGGGRVALHQAEAGSAEEASAVLGFETADLEAFLAEREQAVREAGGTLALLEAPNGTTLALDLPDGERVLVDHSAHPITTVTDASVRPEQVISSCLHVTTRPVEVAGVLAALGLRPRLRSDSGTWNDLTGDGIAAVHATATMTGPPQVVCFEVGDAEHLQRRLRGAGWRCDLVDESYGRTLLVEHPDHPEDAQAEADLPGTRLWINETQTDTYGYVDQRS